MNAERLLIYEHQAESELTTLYRVSMPTYVNSINLFFPDFAAIGYNKHLQRLTPKMVELLFEKMELLFEKVGKV